jgi:hypothetical protein
MFVVPYMVITPFEVNDIIHLRKPHACGGYEWQVVRVGADIGLKCLTCGRRVLLPRSEVQRRMTHRIGANGDQATNTNQQSGKEGL